MNLQEAQVERILIVALSAKDVTPGERKKLRNLIKFYMEKPHPFAACVRDNTKRFGPERAKKVCAVLKDIGRGTTKWRKGRQMAASCPAIDESTAVLLEELHDDEFFRAYLSELA